MAADPGTTTADQELKTLGKISRELDKLDPAAQARTIRWLIAVYVSNPTAVDYHDGTDHDHYNTSQPAGRLNT